MYLIHKTFRFEAAHQLLPGCFTSACSDCVHGHSYRCIITLGSQKLDQHGMVMDFGILKKVIQEIKADWDHGVLLPSEIAAEFARSGMTRQRKIVNFFHNPTAENIARSISDRVTQFLADEWVEVRVVSVKVQETETGVAEYLP